MSVREELAALDAERVELLAKSETEEFTADDAVRAEEVVKRMSEINSDIEKRAEVTARLASIAGEEKSVTPTTDDRPLTGGLGDRFVKSAAYRAFKEANPLPVEGSPVSFKAEDLGGLVAKAEGDGEALSTSLVGAVQYQRMPGIVDLTYPDPLGILDFITTGTTESAYLEYRQLIAVANNAAVVPEKGLKPLSTLTTAVAQAVAYVIADGIKVTNQELADDGVIAALLNSVLTRNVREKIADLVLNGTGTNEPKGILNTSGTLGQTFDTDLVTTARKALTTLRTESKTQAKVFLLSPEDDEALDLIQDKNGQYYGAGPFTAGPSTLWGRPRVALPEVPVGTFITGDLAAVQLLERQGLAVQAFNQNEDDARHNITYLRAECRELLMIREPARILIGEAKAGD